MEKGGKCCIKCERPMGPYYLEKEPCYWCLEAVWAGEVGYSDTLDTQKVCANCRHGENADEYHMEFNNKCTFKNDDPWSISAFGSCNNWAEETS
jgi:hypothetical protein